MFDADNFSVCAFSSKNQQYNFTAENLSFLAISSKCRPIDCSVGSQCESKQNFSSKSRTTQVRILLFGLRYIGGAIRI